MIDPGAPTRERRRHGVVVSGLATGSDTERARAGALVRRAVPPIDRYRAQKLITHRQADAADKLRLDYEIGVLGARSGEPGNGQAPGSAIEIQLDAVARYRRACAQLGRLGMWVLPIVIGTADGGDCTAAALARHYNRSTKAVMALLAHGLDVLGDFYELPE